MFVEYNLSGELIPMVRVLQGTSFPDTHHWNRCQDCEA